jgi:hypothetical protein
MKWKFDPDDVSIKRHINFMYDGDIQAGINDSDDLLKVVSKPECIPDSAVREGTYSIRQKGSYHQVEFFAGYWFDKGNWSTDFAVHNFMLFPSLPDSEYVEMKKYRNRLSKEWRKNVDGYFRWKELRQIGRNIRMWHRQYL